MEGFAVLVSQPFWTPKPSLLYVSLPSSAMDLEVAHSTSLGAAYLQLKGTTLYQGS